MVLFETIPIKVDSVRALVATHWNLELGALLKESQNHTFQASRASDAQRFIVRVTPDPKNRHVAQIRVELELLAYLKKHGLRVCASVDTLSGARSVRDETEQLSICVFDFAEGDAVPYTEWRWLSEQPHVEALGRWMARLHRLSQQFARDHPELAAATRSWRDLHDGVLAGIPVDPRDEALAADPTKFGVNHGDVNCSNYFYVPAENDVCMFDWDQAQRSWYLYDIAQPIWACIMKSSAGSPVDHSPVPEADVPRYKRWFLGAYEAELGERVDLDALERMIEIRRQFYYRFCKRAVGELTEGSFMHGFCTYIVGWLEREGVHLRCGDVSAAAK